MKFTDRVQINGTRTRDDGYLVVDAKIARAGIQQYLGSEVGRPDLNVVNVYRAPEEVFNGDALASFAHRPVTNDHPKEAVTADNWRQFAVGQTADEIKRDGDYVRVPLMVADGAAIKAVAEGKRELSAGYTCELVWGDGVTPDGTPFQAKQTNIRANHVAIVKHGRAGYDCRIGDEAAQPWGTAPFLSDEEKFMGTRTVVVDGLSVETTDQGAQAIEKLTKDRAALQAQLADANNDFQKQLAAKDAALAKKDAELDDAKSKMLDQKAIDALVADRVKLEATASVIAPNVKSTGLSDADLKAAVVKSVLGDSIPADKLANAAYVDARFDILAEDATKAKHPDTFRDARRGSTPPVHQLGDAATERQRAFDELMKYDQTGSDQKAN